MKDSKSAIRLTQYSHGAGCGCKIAPAVLETILSGSVSMPDARLLVGNHSRDDAAVYDLGNGSGLISTTDFFMPIVDDPYDFGRIAAANAISDVYAMGGQPVMAIAILGWPINKIDAEVARQVIAGGRSICQEAGIALAGGHSIDAPEPIFGLAVNGLVPIHQLKKNNTARPGDLLYLTKSLGVGVLTTAEKKGCLQPEDEGLAARQMMQLNRIGAELGKLAQVHALTDVTGFGLLGHLREMADESGVSALLPAVEEIPLLSPRLRGYIRSGSVPGGTIRNWQSYGEGIRMDPSLGEEQEEWIRILADPQTSGGLLVAVDPSGRQELEKLLHDSGLGAYARPIGYCLEREEKSIRVGKGGSTEVPVSA